jgi:hypothetical protein
MQSKPTMTPDGIQGLTMAGVNNLTGSLAELDSATRAKVIRTARQQRKSVGSAEQLLGSDLKRKRDEKATATQEKNNQKRMKQAANLSVQLARNEHELRQMADGSNPEQLKLLINAHISCLKAKKIVVRKTRKHKQIPTNELLHAIGQHMETL